MARRLVALLAVVVAVSAGPMWARPASADCAGPMLRPVAPVVRGDALVIHGEAFGDNCYDTGPPPDGEGALGVPVPDVELSIAQGDGEVVVARGAADADYRFQVEVMVPPRLSPGPARLIARWGDGRTAEQAFEVLADPPTQEPPGTTPVEPFGPDPSTSASTTAPGGGADGDDGSAWATEGATVWAVAATGVLALAFVAAFLVVARRRARADAGQGTDVTDP